MSYSSNSFSNYTALQKQASQFLASTWPLIKAKAVDAEKTDTFYVVVVLTPRSQ